MGALGFSKWKPAALSRNHADSTIKRWPVVEGSLTLTHDPRTKVMTVKSYLDTIP